MIEVDGVRKAFGDKIAVDDLSFRVSEGRIYGLIGPNGAGKTTTLRMLSTLMLPDRGTIRIGGIDIARDPRAVRPILGYMPDHFGTFGSLTALEYLEYFARMYGLAGARREAAIDGVLELTDLGAVADRPSEALSTGVKRRLSLAKTLLPDPKILILDEPAAGLDPRARIEIRALLVEMKSMGKTIVISSHILADIEEIASEVGIIEEGKLVAGGSIQTLKAGLARGTWVEIRVGEGQRERAAEILSSLDGIGSVLGADPFRIDLASHPPNAILEALVRGGIEVLSFRRETPSLEDIFIASTKGKVS
ncbi:MAG: ABC transporter ATP-binding protein [Planctomycetes bacterium]|nr:ABC transporter ATP-binding protein [Planctomycetota bacterium]